jgi:hypothetical protein
MNSLFILDFIYKTYTEELIASLIINFIINMLIQIAVCIKFNNVITAKYIIITIFVGIAQIILRVYKI